MTSRLVDPAPSLSTQQIIRDLETGILSGHWAPGARLPGEETLRRTYQCSRPLVREALQQLKARGLVESRRGSGSYVACSFNADPVTASIKVYSSLQKEGSAYRELLDLRMMIESFCVLRLADKKARGARVQLRKTLNRMKKSTGDLAAFGEADIAFHLALVDGAGHALFSSIMGGLLPGLGVRFAQGTYLDSHLVAKNLQDHEAICEALENGDAPLAQRHLRRHLAFSRRHLESLLAP